jgi:hypothetical protein
MGDSTRVTPALRRLWLAGASVLAVGLLALRLEPQVAVYVCWAGLVLVAAAGGATAARGGSVGRLWLSLTWSVPVLPFAAGAGVLLWLEHQHADPLAVVLLWVFASAAAIATWVVFTLALVVETVRLRLRRRFGDPRPAWKNEPIQPS